MRLRDVLPPIITDTYARQRDRRRDGLDILFEGSDALFKRVVAEAKVYGEYGVGASTEWAYANTTARIISVDTSSEWLARVSANKDPGRFVGRHVDVGEVRDWGYPRDFSKRRHFPLYFDAIWSGPVRPDVVLVDGRFRVCCFLTSLLSAGPGVRIVFDDYLDRPRYHVVEEVIEPVEYCGRQALFVVPEAFDRGAGMAMIDEFRMVVE